MSQYATPLQSTMAEAARMTADLTTMLTRISYGQFQELEQKIKNRKMFVLFEDALGCDPMTDHVSPKNVLPLFADYIRECQRHIREFDANFLLQSINDSFTKIVQEEAQQRVKAQAEVHILGGRVHQLEELLKQAESSFESSLKLVHSLKIDAEQQSQQIKEQYAIQQRYGRAYKGDDIQINNQDENADPVSSKQKLDAMTTYLQEIKNQMQQMRQGQNNLIGELTAMREYKDKQKT
ncbi:Coiled-coil_protein [Hexamita inflata]|uniref:Coiled-coil protein n=1 Tax=Hexamita inflata TaxID=28002 RepID=A0AA86THM5_9EUKA|nr:Coiled-coil protein [Hexamita inflata]